MVSFSELKENIRIEEVCTAYGLNVKMKGSQGRGPCPCGSGGDRALAVNTDKQSAYCFGARAGGDLIWLISHVRKCSQRDAAEDIAKQFKFDSSPTTPKSPPEKTEDLYLETLKDMIEDLEARVSALEDNKVIKLRAT